MNANENASNEHDGTKSTSRRPFVKNVAENNVGNVTIYIDKYIYGVCVFYSVCGIL